MEPFAATGPVQFEGVGGVHSSGPLEDPKNRSRPGRPRHNPRYASAPERIGHRPGTLLSLFLLSISNFYEFCAFYWEFVAEFHLGNL